MKHVRLIPLAAFALASLAACYDQPTDPEAQPSPSASYESSMGDPFSAGLAEVARGLTAPVALMEFPDGTGRLAVADQAGLIRIIAADGAMLEEPFLDVRDRMVPLGAFGPGTFDERGLLGLAFHPEYAANGRFFVYYSAPGGPAGYNHTSHVSEFRASGDPDRAEAMSEQVLLRIPEPQFNHNAGALAFGPDGMLYISVGDGGGGGDIGFGHVEDWYAANGGGNGQDITENLLGSILRIDVATPGMYTVPADNPFVGVEGLDEIYAYGLRNPYRMSFDMGGELGLLVSDAGQNLWEEVSQVTKGGNYGWNVKEGTSCFNTASFRTPLPDCPDVVLSGPRQGDPLTDPVIEYANNRNPQVPGLGVVVVGGFVYRGDVLPQFRGRYIFGDWSTSFRRGDGTILVASPRMSGQWQIQEIAITAIRTPSGVQDNPDGRIDHFVLGFGQDAAGEVYVLASERSAPFGETGKVYRLIKPSGKTPGR